LSRSSTFFFMNRSHRTIGRREMRGWMVACLLVTSGCGASGEPARPTEPSGSARLDTTPSTTAPSASPAPPDASAIASATTSSPTATADVVPGEIEYPVRGLATIPDDCSEPSTVLTTAPTKVGWDYDWMWTRQAMLANPQFQIVDGPGKP